MNHPDEAALYAAQEIEDIFAMGHVGGRAQRLARVQVAIVSAITRCMPPSISEIPEPATSTTVQDEAVVDQGEDQPAQKGEVSQAPPSARAASAEHNEADPRNSSCGPAVVADPGPQTDQPYVTKRERALILFSTTSLSYAEIAEALDSTENSIRATLNKAGRDGDPRAIRSLAPLAAKLNAPEPVAPPPSPTEKAIPVSTPAPADEPSLPIITLQEAGFRIAGRKGKPWATDEATYLTVELLSDGHMHSLADMMKAGGWATTGQVKRKLGLIHDRLEEIGVRLIHISDIGCRIEVIR